MTNQPDSSLSAGGRADGARPARSDARLTLSHAALIALGLTLLYGWITALPMFADSLYLTTTRLHSTTLAEYLRVLDPRMDTRAMEATRAVSIYRPVFLEVVVPFIHTALPWSPAVIYALNLVLAFATAMAFYVLSLRMCGCPHSAFVVAAFVGFHPALFEIFLFGYAGLNYFFTYLAMALSFVFAWRFGDRATWLTVGAMVVFALVATFSYERASLLPLGLVLMVTGWRLSRHRVSGEGAAHLVRRLGGIKFVVFLIVSTTVTGAYFAARLARFGTPVASHYGADPPTMAALLKQLGALGLGVVGIVPPYAPPWFGVNVLALPWSTCLLVLGYAFLVIGMVSYSLYRRPIVTGSALALVGFLILPNVAATSVLTIRYADMPVLGLAVVLSAAPLLAWSSPAKRVGLSLTASAFLFVVAAAHEHTAWSSPQHFLTNAARSAIGVRAAVAATPGALRDRDIHLMSGFFNFNEMWVFNATPSRLGAFFSANFDIDRARVRRFSPALHTDMCAVLIDYYHEPDGRVLRTTGFLAAAGSPRTAVPVRWDNQTAFACHGGDVVAISGRRTRDRSNARQYVRLVFDRGGSDAFTVLELFGNYQDVRRGETGDDSTVYALVPTGTISCQVRPDGLAPGNVLTRVERLPEDAPDQPTGATLRTPAVPAPPAPVLTRGDSVGTLDTDCTPALVCGVCPIRSDVVPQGKAARRQARAPGVPG